MSGGGRPPMYTESDLAAAVYRFQVRHGRPPLRDELRPVYGMPSREAYNRLGYRRIEEIRRLGERYAFDSATSSA